MRISSVFASIRRALSWMVSALTCTSCRVMMSRLLVLCAVFSCALLSLLSLAMRWINPLSSVSSPTVIFVSPGRT